MIAAFDTLAAQHAAELAELEAENDALRAQRDALLAALAIAEDFMSGFEDDETQEGMAAKMAEIRAAIAAATEKG